MARSIGAVKIRKIKAMVETKYKVARSAYNVDAVRIAQEVREEIPDEWYEIWESAWAEIDRVIRDSLTELLYGKD